jgi:hypothetical protein
MPTLELDQKGNLVFDVAAFVGKCVAVLGITGSGKSNTVAVLIEELLAQGLAATIVDIENEYWGLAERHELLIAGRSPQATLPLEVETAGLLAELSLERNISVVLDLSEHSQNEASEILLAYMTRLWEVAGKLRKPYLVVVEEAHEFIPQGMGSPLKQILTRLALRGRKRGLSLLLASQRSAKVEKDVLTQAALLFLHQVVHPIDVKVYKDLIPWPASQVEEVVPRLLPGQALVIRSASVQLAEMRRRYTFDAGATPEFGVAQAPALRQVDAAMLAELQALFQEAQQQKQQRATPNKEAPLHQRIRDLEAELAQVREENERLRTKQALPGQQHQVVSAASMLSVEQATVGQLILPAGDFVPRSQAELEVAAGPLNVALPAFEGSGQRRYNEFRDLLKHLAREKTRAELAYAILRELTRTPAMEMARADLLLVLHIPDVRHYRDLNIEALLENRRLIRVSRRGASHTIYYRSCLQERLRGILPERNDYAQLVLGLFSESKDE